eukprot:scaffold1724_cov341-Pavlova_lutheri.AAC.68
MDVLGVVQDDQLYLVDRDTGVAYACDGSGERKAVGTYRADVQEVVLHEVEAVAGVDDPQDEEGRRGEVDGATVVEEVEGEPHPWDADPADHCETPGAAHEDLEAVLLQLASMLGKAKHELVVYDPYYCTGKAGSQLKKMGFLRAYNKCEDFYQKMEHGDLPDYDCIVTNPPYSAVPVDHVKALMEFLMTKQDKPWFVLQPNYVYMKDYWEAFCGKLVEAAAQPRPFFLTPASPRKYVYKVPKALRQELKSKARNTAPFVTFWYCWLDRPLQKRFMKWWHRSGQSVSSTLSLAVKERCLPNNFKDSSDRTRRKKGGKKRKRPAEGNVTSY